MGHGNIPGTRIAPSGNSAAPVRRAPVLLLLGSTILASSLVWGHGVSLAQSPEAATAQATSFSIPAQPLASALHAFSRASGWQIGYSSEIVRGKTSVAVSGTMPPARALQTMLSGTGISVSLTGPTTATLVDRVAQAFDVPADGAMVLATIDVQGSTENTAYTPYETPAPTSHITADDIERFRGSSPADIFRGTAGVMSGEARNGAGAVDVNIRGMQGMGRVATTIDGAENAVTVYQGYQGVSNRTFVDPDFIAGVDITKGADTASWGNAGSVAMRTVSADDIVKPGNTWGVRVKGEIGTNTSKPHAGDKAGYQWPYAPWDAAGEVPVASQTGMDRPSLLSPTRGAGSVIGAYKGEDFDFLAGYARRKQGNYHAGKHGPSANPVNKGRQQWCPNGVCNPNGTTYWENYYENDGIVNYRAGEEVLNTQLETESWLAKLTARFAEDHTLQLGYTGYRSEAGDRLASRLIGKHGQSEQQAQTAGTSLDTVTARYRWNPEDSDLFDLKGNLYWTHLELRNPIRGGRGVTPEQIGLPAGFRVGSDSDMWGADLSNLSKFSTDYGDVDLTYGLSYRGEDTRGSRHTAALEAWNTARDAVRHEAAVYAKTAWKPVDWATLNAGLRYSHFWSKDRYDPYERDNIESRVLGFRTDDGGFSPSVSVTLEPFDGSQFYVNYSNTLRAPSVIESVSAFNSVVANANVKPERSSNWEVGTNLTRDGLFMDDDRGMLKLGYFNWDVKDYIARSVRTGSGPLTLNIENIDRARFSGIELSGRYEIGGFTADLSANYFLNVEYCRTATTCENKSLYGDYATNHVQPEYTVDLTLSQKLLEDRMTVGGRISHIGPRAIGHGDVTAQGASEFISMVNWKPYTLVDLFAEYKITEDLTTAVRVENLFDRFYVDPLGLVTQPGPGRTFYASLTGSFGGEQTFQPLTNPLGGLIGGRGGRDGEPVAIDWSGLYAGVHAGGAFGHTWGSTTTLDGSDSSIAARESADLKLNGAMFGVQAGYNWQLDNGLVFGFEGDWSKTYNITGSKKVLSTDPILATKGHVDAYTSYDIDWMASLRPKIGYAFSDRFMAYATGGLALARETQWRDQYISNLADEGRPNGTETTVFSVEKAAATRAGFTIGGGLEYALNDNWSIKADYTYSRFGKKDFKFRNARAGTGRDYTTTTSAIVGYETVDPSQDPNMAWLCDMDPSFCEPYEQPIYETTTTNHTGSSSTVNGRNASNALDFHTIKIGLNYRF
ncbi:TonB-dependent receptor domain-containing protein [Aquamicrobium terrae]|uniref:Hemoglobin/transferrin/lactoferrin receptor protein n=1 Tax=Aquamicrobium terrae TaxID=1324945 RepID=A0ABV2MZX7_9HYPH